MQSDLHPQLHRTLSNYVEYGMLGHCNEDLGYLADLSDMIAHERYQQYRECVWRCSNNRARFFKLQAYEHCAQSLLILNTRLDPAERFHARTSSRRNSDTAATAYSRNSWMFPSRWLSHIARTAVMFWSSALRTRNVGSPVTPQQNLM